MTLREDFKTGASVGNASISDDRTDEGDRSYRSVILMEVSRWFYSRRGVDLDSAISSRLPEDYRILTPRFTELGGVLGCQDLDVLLDSR